MRAPFPILLAATLLTPGVRAQSSAPIIVDTDVGSDDLMAIAFLLSHPEVRVEAITVANGLAHVRAGASNALRLLELAGHNDIPVYLGAEVPMRGHAEFPAEWRQTSDQLPGVQLPKAGRKPEAQPAAGYLADRWRQSGRPVRILALGPLTNIATALQRAGSKPPSLERIVIMGGAIDTPGNLGDGGAFKTANKTAEWNIFVDPFAADIVFRSGVPIRLVPLDATNQVKIDAALLKQLRSARLTRLGQFVSQVLGAEEPMIKDGSYYAWDPLAAVSLIAAAVLKTTPLRIEIRQTGAEAGRTIRLPNGPANTDVALNANALEFRRAFLNSFVN
jgi:inosine-uridine nucleoside N-ribohydrolase